MANSLNKWLLVSERVKLSSHNSGLSHRKMSTCNYHILSSIVCTFFKENCDEMLPADYTLKVPDKGSRLTW